MEGRKPRWHCQVALTVGGASVSVVAYAVVAVWFCQCFAPSSDRCDDDLLVSESRASVRHDAVWKLGNLRLSGHQHKGGRWRRHLKDGTEPSQALPGHVALAVVVARGLSER